MYPRLKGGSCFSGVGLLDYGLKEYVKTEFYIERDKYCQSVLQKNIEEGLLDKGDVLSDIRSVSGFQLPRIDLLSGGFPCQDISGHNPNGTGLKGKRSGMFWEFARLVNETKPRYIFLENVAAITRKGLREVATFFTQEGYDSEWLCLPASSIGAPHRRERWFFFASVSNSSSFRCENWGNNLQGRQNHKEENILEKNKSTGNRGKFVSSKVSPVDIKGRYYNEQAKLWEIEPTLARVVHGGTSQLDAIKALGNACVPAQSKLAYEILTGINILKNGGLMQR